MSQYYSTDSTPITLEEWIVLFEQRGKEGQDFWKVGNDKIGDVEISTVWLGLDHNFNDEGPPLIFESMIFGGNYDEEQHRYSTWAEAEEGHKKLVEKVKNGTKG